MPAPNLGLVGARGVGALQKEIQTMEAERRAAEVLAYKRQQDEKEAAELGRHRKALEDYQLGDLETRRSAAEAQRAAAAQAAADREEARNKPTVHSGLASSDAAVKGKVIAAIRPDGTVVWEKPMAAEEPKPADNTTPEDFVALRKAEHAAAGKPWTSDDLKAAMRDYNLGTTREPREPQEPRPFKPVIIQTANGLMKFDFETNTATPVKDEGGRSLQPQDTAEVRNRRASAKAAEVIIDQIEELSGKINTQKGVMANIQGTIERGKAEINLNDDVAVYQGLIESSAPLVARIMGRVGVLTENDEKRVLRGLPRVEDSHAVATRKIAVLRRIMDALIGGADKAAVETDLIALDALSGDAPAGPAGATGGRGRGAGGAGPAPKNQGGAAPAKPTMIWDAASGTFIPKGG